jgi:hypothetical protein
MTTLQSPLLPILSCPALLCLFVLLPVPRVWTGPTTVDELGLSSIFIQHPVVGSTAVEVG